ncbi:MULTISPECIES: pantoate--beta-alanine ligase [unclassified Psychrobacillus]|mgnify:FL=1|uniref:pantoate--beta-alanine ligase n=1 Tax=unclassified Psychrobacillus TaxID=2636677 RepID=UPI00146B08C9|nr:MULTISPECIES: pantoate--beta-alanine ligase [unclassified Psychrobacillus]MCM3358781.1 pantoate--beta-alanine ligase [Psychrobacillus sp. MER TA 171]NME05824.1 pantoate--beta-alanine ligase [Psychrobacillus sp. BL-248-WT-3]
MQTVQKIDELKAIIAKHKQHSIGFVPTMGYLHEGHQALLTKARAENEFVVASIFVNPAQFGPNEDLDRYPRDIERDTKIAVESGVDLLFVPTPDEMYPFESGITIHAGDISTKLCGSTRPGHFDGVLKVVSKLFHLVQPTKAYFGQKDAQQLAIIKLFVEAYNFPLEIVAVPTIREEDGLAKSSRNVFLSAQEREVAPHIYKALTLAKENVHRTGDVQKAIAEAKQYIIENTSGKIDYLEALAYPTLQPVNEYTEEVLFAAAVFFEKARLIDNIIVNMKEVQ